MTRDEVQAHVKGFQSLEWANSWDRNPWLFERCHALGHAMTDVDIGPPHRGLEHVVWCDECKIFYRYDSSD